MKSSHRIAILLSLCSLVSVLLFTGNVCASDPDSLHWAAWDEVLANAEGTPPIRYSFYAYRTLAVPHPEIYLRADALFSEMVESMPGSRSAYRGVDVRNVELFRELLNGEREGPSFSWRLWAPLPDSIYDPHSDFGATSWLDRRVAPAAVLLTALSPYLSTAEAAMMRYTQLRRFGQPDSNLFVLIDTAGQGYLVQDGIIHSAVTGRKWSGDGGEVVPALVFNERSVFYPLFGRDDRGNDAQLAQLLEGLAAPAPPAMTLSDHERVDRLRQAAALSTESQEWLATLAAFGATGVENPVVRSAWERAIGEKAVAQPGCAKGMMRLIIYWANHFSKPMAELATLAPATNFDSAATTWQETYLSWCGRQVNPRDTINALIEAGGYLWGYELIDVIFDDIIRTHSGPPSSQSLTMAVVLDRLEIPNVRLGIDMGEKSRPNQTWVLADQGRWQFNLGIWTQVDMEERTIDRVSIFLDSYGIEGRWTNLKIPFNVSNADMVTINADLTRIKLLMPQAEIVLRSPQQEPLLLSRLMMLVIDGEVRWSPMPWPEAGEHVTGALGGSR